jgi:hypothetical protein
MVLFGKLIRALDRLGPLRSSNYHIGMKAGGERRHREIGVD